MPAVGTRKACMCLPDSGVSRKTITTTLSLVYFHLVELQSPCAILDHPLILSESSSESRMLGGMPRVHSSLNTTGCKDLLRPIAVPLKGGSEQHKQRNQPAREWPFAVRSPGLKLSCRFVNCSWTRRKGSIKGYYHLNHGGFYAEKGPQRKFQAQ
jgi:hypothetical protein